MNNSKAKLIRKKMNKIATEIRASTFDSYASAPFFTRLILAWRIIRGKTIR